MVEWICALVFGLRELLCVSVQERWQGSALGEEGRKPAEAQGLSPFAAKVCPDRTGLVLGEDESRQAVNKVGRRPTAPSNPWS